MLMGAGFHGGFGGTKGSKTLFPLNLQFFAARVFEKGGHISKESFEGHRESAWKVCPSIKKRIGETGLRGRGSKIQEKGF